jgi:copper chaperone CopZ
MPTLSVDGMSCTHCEGTVEEALREVSGVTDVAADHERGEVRIEGDVDLSAAARAVEDAGYTPRI